MTLYDFLAPWPPKQEILIFFSIPEIPVFDGPIGKLRYSQCVGLSVISVRYVGNSIYIRVVKHGGTK